MIIISRSLENSIEVNVEDNGIGISEELKPRIFDRFFRSGNIQTQSYPGMGPGLYISAGIIKRHEGTISVRSKGGEGCVFSFTLPFKSDK